MQNIPKRTKGKFKADFKLRDFYKFYIKSLDKVERETGYLISYQQFSRVMKASYKEIVELIFQNEEIILPARCGLLRIRKLKQTIYPVDWKATNELRAKDKEAEEKKIKIRHLNEHTDGAVYKWHWNRYPSNIRNKSAYAFTTTRTNNRRLNSLLKEENGKTTFNRN